MLTVIPHRAGLTMITLDENDVMDGVEDPPITLPDVSDLPQYNTQNLFEMEALDCICKPTSEQGQTSC